MSYTGYRLTGRNAVVSRPADKAQVVPGSTWAADRSSATADDGTEIDATWVNRVRASLERLADLGDALGDGDDQLRNSVAAYVEDYVEAAIAAAGVEDIKVVQFMADAEALTGLQVGDVVHVNTATGNGWQRYQITSAGNGTWAGATKVLIWAQGQLPASHTHAIADTTGLQTALDELAGGGKNLLGRDLFENEEGIAVDFLRRRARINDYLDVTTTAWVRPGAVFPISRASTKWVMRKNGLIGGDSANTYGFDYDPVTREPRGVLIEPAATNLLTYSEQIDNAAWSKTATSISANSIAAPSGATTADKIVEDGTTAAHDIRNGLIPISTTSASTCSFFAKAAERSVLHVRYGSQSLVNRGQGSVDLSNGQVAIVSNVGAASGTTMTATDVGGGWYRIAISTNPNDGASTQVRVLIMLQNVAVGSATGLAYTGDGTSGLYVWGAQVEAGTVATSYIPTTVAAVTRNADAAAITDILDLPILQTQGTLFVEFSRPAIVSGTRMLALSDGLSSNSIVFTSGIAVPEQIRADVVVGGVTQASLSLTMSSVANEIYRAAIAYRANDFRAVLNGGPIVSDTSGSLPTVSRMDLGGISVTNQSLHIRRVRQFLRPLSSTELQALTSLGW